MSCFQGTEEMYHQQILLPQSLQGRLGRLRRLAHTVEVLVGQQEALGIHLTRTRTGDGWNQWERGGRSGRLVGGFNPSEKYQ